MPYEQDDPRSQLATATAKPMAAPRPAGASFPPQYFELGSAAPDEVSDGGTATSYVRSQSCALAFSEVAAGDRLTRVGQPDEYVALFPSLDASAVITAGDDRIVVRGTTVAVLPPGDSEIAVETAGVVVRIFSPRTTDVMERCRNADAYVEPDPYVTPFEPWPDPVDGHRVRAYALADVPDEPGRFGRIFRCSTIMVNYLPGDDGARDPSKLSPHHHDDFEQISLQLEGAYVHHMRTSWTTNLAHWRDDDHRLCISPAITIIPPPTIHTSQSVNDERHQLIDIFCPPRMDFSLRPGWVLNHDEYPMP
jgi:hypothetical protein